MRKRDIENERRFLQEECPEMADRTAEASDIAIMIAFDMLDLDSEELEMFMKYLESRLRAE